MDGFIANDAGKRCFNCHQKMEVKAVYCSNCGQKYTDGRIKLKTLILEFFETVLNIESKFFQTLGALFIPGKLTNEFFKGRHQSYFRPLRIFLIMTILHFTVIAFVVNNVMEDEVSEAKQKILSNAYRISFIQAIDTIQPQLEAYYNPKDTLVRASIDSLQRHMHRGVDDSTSVNYATWVPSKGLQFNLKKIGSEDIFQLPKDEILEKYEIEGFVSRLTVGQSIRVWNNLDNILGFVIGNFTWMLLLMMPALAFLLKILYIRRKQYFVEHLIFSFHYHAFAFLIASPAYLFVEVFPLGIPLAFTAILVYLLFAMRRVYQQGWIKTFVKFIILNNLYLFVLTFFAIFMVIISALVF